MFGTLTPLAIVKNTALSDRVSQDFRGSTNFTIKECSASKSSLGKTLLRVMTWYKKLLRGSSPSDGMSDCCQRKCLLGGEY